MVRAQRVVVQRQRLRIVRARRPLGQCGHREELVERAVLAVRRVAPGGCGGGLGAVGLRGLEAEHAGHAVLAVDAGSADAGGDIGAGRRGDERGDHGERTGGKGLHG